MKTPGGEQSRKHEWATPPSGRRPTFTGAERAALALTAAFTRLSHRVDPVSDEIWYEAGGMSRNTPGGTWSKAKIG